MNDDSTPDQHIQPAPFELSGRQRALFEALSRINKKLGAMYEGCLRVLETDITYRHAFAAHAIREIIEKLPRYMGLSRQAHNEQMGARANELHRAWTEAFEKSKCRTNGKWSGELDNVLKTFLEKADDFYALRKSMELLRRDEVAEFIRALDPGRGRLPEKVETVIVESVQDMRDFFMSVCHGKDAETADFHLEFNKFERFMLDRLQPRPFDNLEKIDAIIAEGEAK